MDRLEEPLFQAIGIVPDVIKIDAESAEVQVLQGLRRTLQSVRPVIALEVGDHAHLVAKGIPRSVDFLQIAVSHRYALFEPTLDGIRPHELQSGDYDYGNIIAVPEEKQTGLERIMPLASQIQSQ